ncbi:hypothetical protein Taro_051608 [Colocasia esculenta]|uniref:Uncharacterized protein n=1 Tax=Colocasia esculenta TaxID=4460 RepID=A0A843XH94_COLES|nr:hypothetical protein [Colocasia esculenta]
MSQKNRSTCRPALILRRPPVPFSKQTVLGTRSSVDLISSCVDLLSHSANRLFWERGPVSTRSHPAST